MRKVITGSIGGANEPPPTLPETTVPYPTFLNLRRLAQLDELPVDALIRNVLDGYVGRRLARDPIAREVCNG